ncbi:hypothetical protein B0H13DRAFT_1903590 [Mycena leptocephala]|nr:hypothetical protein B0H13DRAFT_1903590 [Mycena leptocephala]
MSSPPPRLTRSFRRREFSFVVIAVQTSPDFALTPLFFSLQIIVLQSALDIWAYRWHRKGGRMRWTGRSSRTLPAVIRLSAAAARIVSVPVQSGILYLTPPLLASGGRAGCAMRAWEKSFFLELPKAHLRTLPVVSDRPTSFLPLPESRTMKSTPIWSDRATETFHSSIVLASLEFQIFKSMQNRVDQLPPVTEHAANLKAKSFEHLEVSVSNKRHSFLGLLWTFRTQYLSMR